MTADSRLAPEAGRNRERGRHELHLLTPFQAQPLLDAAIAIGTADPRQQKAAEFLRYAHRRLLIAFKTAGRAKLRHDRLRVGKDF